MTLMLPSCGLVSRQQVPLDQAHHALAAGPVSNKLANNNALLDRPCQPPTINRNSELCAQWTAADAAGEAAWWAMAGTLIAGLGTLGLYWQLILTRRAVQDTSVATEAMARQTLLTETSQRPWVKVDYEPDWLLLYADNISLSGTVKLTNIGLTPAQNVRTSSTATLIGTENRDIRDPNNRIPPSSIITHAILPSDTKFDQELTFFNWKEDPQNGEFRISIIVTALYDLPNGEFGETTVSYVVGRPSDEKDFPSPFRRDEGTERHGSGAINIVGLISTPSLYGLIA